jgi:hypothetical protein
MSTHGLLFQWSSTIHIQFNALFYNKADLIIIFSLTINLFSPWNSWQMVELALNNNHSLTDTYYNRHISIIVESFTGDVINMLTLSTWQYVPRIKNRSQQAKIEKCWKVVNFREIPSAWWCRMNIPTYCQNTPKKTSTKNRSFLSDRGLNSYLRVY